MCVENVVMKVLYVAIQTQHVARGFDSHYSFYICFYVKLRYIIILILTH